MDHTADRKLYDRDRVAWAKEAAPRLVELFKTQPWRKQWVREHGSQALKDELNRLLRLK